MLNRIPWIAPCWIVLIAMTFFLGCKTETPQTDPGKQTENSTDASNKGDSNHGESNASDPQNVDPSNTTTNTPMTPEAPAKPIVPPVELGEAHAKTCLVKVGDTFPEVSLSDLEGNEADFSKLLGKKLTVVLFWTSEMPGDLYSEEALQDIALQVEQGISKLPEGTSKPEEGSLNIVGVYHGESAAKAKEVLELTQAKFPQLNDDKNQLFEKVATEKRPRVYLLDADKKIIWFDMEYSLQTKKRLQQAITASLVE